MTKTKFFIINLFFYSILFPFLSIYPIGSDLQPIFIIVAILIIVFRYVKFFRRDIFLLSIALLSLFYFNYLTFDLSPFKGFGAYLSICISIFLLLTYEKIFNLNIFISVLKKSTIIYFISSIIFYIFPEIFTAFQLNFVRSINTLETGMSFRGISTYFTEPGLFGGHMAGLLVLFISLFENDIINFKKIFPYVLMIIIMIIMSKSGMGYLYLIFIGLYIIISNRKKVKIVVPIILLLSFLTSYNYESIIELNRGLSAIASLSDFSNLSDFSILKRIYDFLLGFFILFEYPFGMGVNFTQSNVVDIITSYPFLYNFYDTYKEIGFVSSTALFLAYYGLFLFLIIFYIVKRYKPRFINVFFALCFMSFSFSGAYPLIWILFIQDYVLSKFKTIKLVKIKSKMIN